MTKKSRYNTTIIKKRKRKTIRPTIRAGGPCIICDRRKGGSAAVRYQAECIAHHVHPVHKKCAKSTPRFRCPTCQFKIEFVIRKGIIADVFAIRSAKRGFQQSQRVAEKNAIEKKSKSK